MELGTVDYETGTKHGSIYEMGFEHWWEPDEVRGRAVPPTPEELRFEADRKAWVESGFLRLKGWLVNETEHELTVGLFAAPRPFTLKMSETERIKKKPYTGPVRPPPAPPPPTVLFVPPRTRVEFLAVVDLGQYEYEPGAETELRWTFNFWNSPKPTGDLKAKLD